MKRTLLRYGVILVCGFFGSRVYYQWLASSSLHKIALHRYGAVGYWFWIALPAFVMSILFFGFLLVTRAARSRPIFIAVSALGCAVLAAYLAVFGDFLWCVFVTRGVCK